MPANPPAGLCRPANDSTTLSFPGETYMYKLVTAAAGQNDARTRCFANVENQGGGRMWIPRALAAQKRIELYFEQQNPSMSRYWAGEWRSCWLSCPALVCPDNQLGPK